MELTELEIKQGYKLDSFGRKYHNGNMFHRIHGDNWKPKRKRFKRNHGRVKRVRVTESYYNQYINGEIWKRKRDEMVLKFGNCFICDSSWNLNVHHLTYYDNRGKSILGKERMNDLLVLCRDCHKMIHDKGIAYDFRAIKLLRKEK